MSAAGRWLFVLAAAVCVLAVGCASGTGERSADFCRPESLQGWQFAAVHFLSSRVGVGVTAAGFECPVPSATGTVTWRRQTEPVEVAVTRDGGATWRAEGARLPVVSDSSTPIAEQLVASSPGKVYALASDGELLATSNAGGTWARESLPGPVLQLAMSGGTVWALACPATPNSATAPALMGLKFCRPVLERAVARGGSWTLVSVPSVSEVIDVSLAAATGNLVVLEIDHAAGRSGELLYTLDGGLRWRREAVPRWDGYPQSCGMFAAAAPRTWWFLCLGGAAVGSSTKGLLRSTDYGRTWKTVSQVTSLLTPQPPDSTQISRAEPNALAAGSSRRLWLAFQNGMGESADGGARWTNVPGIDPQGVGVSFDVLSSTHAWLAVPGEGLWRTTDGSDWSMATRLKPCSSSQLRLEPGPPISEPTQQDSRLLTLTNVSMSACGLDGYPTVILLDRRGVRLPFQYRDHGDQVLTSLPPQPVPLLPLEQAYEAINKNSCVGRIIAIATRIRVTLPHAVGTVTMPLARYPLLDYCPAGDPGHVLDVSPFEPVPTAVFASHQ